MADQFLVSLFEHKAWCNAGLAEALRTAPKDVDRTQWAVIMFTFDHTANVDRIFQARLLGETPELSSTIASCWPNIDALTSSMAKIDSWYLDYVRAVTPAELEEVIDFSFVDDGAQGRMSRGDMLAHVITHSASHRGAIGKMLEGIGIRGPSDMVTTFRRIEAI